MEWIKNIQKLLDGKKTYIIAILTGILGIVSAYHPIPDVVWTILAALGLGTIRSAIGPITSGK